jgi:hypothetical protein
MSHIASRAALQPRIPDLPESMRLIVVRQVRPGDRVRALISIPAGTLLPLPDEALTHAAGHEPMPGTPQAFSDLRDKYAAHNSS